MDDGKLFTLYFADSNNKLSSDLLVELKVL